MLRYRSTKPSTEKVASTELAFSEEPLVTSPVQVVHTQDLMGTGGQLQSLRLDFKVTAALADRPLNLRTVVVPRATFALEELQLERLP